MDFVSPYSQVWSQAVVIAAAHIAANQRTMRMLPSVIAGPACCLGLDAIFRLYNEAGNRAG
jgi:hypothetical protein